MSYRMVLQPNPLSRRLAKYTPGTLRHIGKQVEALVSQHSGLKIHKRAIEQQLASIAAQIHEEDVVLLPRNVFLLLEIRGSGGVSEQLEQIARLILEEATGNRESACSTIIGRGSITSARVPNGCLMTMPC